MKKTVITALIAILSISLAAQSDQERGHQKGSGLFLSMSMGPSYLSINDDISGGDYSNMTFKGIGGAIDIQLGTVVKENTILHLDIVYTSTGSADVTADGSPLGTISGENSIGMTMLGGGATKYFMPQNIFISGTVGAGSFNVTSGEETASTQRGLGLFLKIGKEWFIAKNWDIGFNIGLNYTNVTNEIDSMSEKLSGIAVSAGFNATFN